MIQKNQSLWRLFILAVAALSLLWVAGMLYLDFAYEMFPRVLLGGLKILAAGYLVLAVLILPVYGLLRLLRSRQQV